MSLAMIFDRKGQLDEAERYWKRATSLDQERIESGDATEIATYST